MNTVDHALAVAWLLDKADGDGTVEFNTFYPFGGVQANQVALADLREYPLETMQNFLAWGEWQKSKISVGVNIRRQGIAKKMHHGLPYDGFGVKSDITQCTAFFVDADLPDRAIDLAELVDYDPQPSLVVQSSPGRFHAYWKMAQPLDITCADDIARYEGVQKGLANYFGFKPMNIRQVMGLPGSLNFKYDPPQSRLVVFANEKNLYSDWEQFPSVYTATPIRDYEIEVYNDGEIPQDAIAQLRDYMGRHGGRNNAIFSVAAWLRDLAIPQHETLTFIVNQCRSLSAYQDFPNRDIENCVKSAYRS